MTSKADTPAEDDPVLIQSPGRGQMALASTLMGATDDASGHFTEDLAAARPAMERHVEPARVLARVKQSLLDITTDPLRLGRFMVIDCLGQGGMGVVYSAYDPELDRKVALKLLRAVRHSDAARDRLKREAQALAKLSHANVVPVHDVAVVDDQVVVVMEFIKGTTVRQWLAQESPDWRAILRVYLEAARGLAAAHRAGIVHRDFKPDNVLVGDDGRVRVVDFGLARASARSNTESEVEIEVETGPALVRSSSLDSDLTQAGAILGTPAYMSPEQQAGRATDHPTDQYSFCVSLHEGLYGSRPQDMDSWGDTDDGAERPDVEDASPTASERSVPAWLYPILKRGLEADPDARWPSIEALITALEDDPLERQRRRRNTALRTLILLAVVAGLGWLAWFGWLQAGEERERKRLAEVERDEARIDLAEELRRSRDAARILAAESLGRDPTKALSILREVEDPVRTPRWPEMAAVALRKPVAERILTGDGTEVPLLAFSPDGAHLASASSAGPIHIWSMTRDAPPRTLTGHTGRIVGLSFSPDSRLLATASRDGTARVFSLQDGRPPVVLRGHDGALWSVAFSPDGTRVATVGDDRNGRIWSPDGTGQPVVLRGHAQPIHTVAFGPGGIVATGSSDGTARLWTSSGQPLAVLEGHEARVWHLDFSPDGALLATSSRDQTARLWRIADATGHQAGNQAGQSTSRPPSIRVLKGHTRSVNTLAFSPDGSLLATGSSDRTVRLWRTGGPNGDLDDGATDTDPIVLTGHEGFISTVAFSPDGRQLVSSSADGTARVWSTDGRTGTIVLRGHTSLIATAAFAPDAPLVATGSLDTTTRLWRVPAQPARVQFYGHTEPVLHSAFSPDGTRVATASFDKTALIYHTDGRSPPTIIADHTDHVRFVQFSPDGTRVVTASTDTSARIHDLGEGTSTGLVGHTAMIFNADFSPDGTQLVTASADQTVRLWNADGDTAPTVLTGHNDLVLQAVFSPDGKRVLSVSESMARITEIAGDRVPLVLDGAALWPETVRFSPDGRQVALAADMLVELRNSRTGASVSTLAGHTATITSLAFSRDGSLLVTGSQDRSAMVWDLANARAIATLRGHRNSVLTVTFSPDGRLVLTSSNDRTARVWNADGSGHPVVLAGHQADITTARFSPDGQTALTTTTDGSVALWRKLTPAQSLSNALWRATAHCMPVEDRRDLLGSSRQVARADHERCLKRVTRTSSRH